MHTANGYTYGGTIRCLTTGMSGGYAALSININYLEDTDSQD